METHALRERIDSIERLRGRGTELVTVSVPPGKELGAVRRRVADERAEAENIRSDRTRENVRRALDRVRRVLAGYEETPENGLVAYAGVVDGELRSFVFDDLPRPVPSSTYRCGDRFDVEPLAAAAAPGEEFGLVVVERGGAALGRLVGDRVVPVRTVESHVMGQTRAGGQSAQRFARERERQAHEFFETVGAAADEAFLGEDPVAGVAVGGTLGTAEAFVAGEYLDHRLQERILGTYAVEYASEQGLHQLVEKARGELLGAQRREVRRRLEEFFVRLREGDPVAYGEDEVRRATEYGAVDTALLATTVPAERREELTEEVESMGGEILVVSTDTDRGSRLAEAFGGVGALLRFPVN